MVFMGVPWIERWILDSETQHGCEDEVHLRSKLTEDALGADIRGALVVGIAHVFLEALVVACAEGPHVGLEHGDTGQSGVTDGVLATHGPGCEGSMGERGLQGVQKVHYDVDELQN